MDGKWRIRPVRNNLFVYYRVYSPNGDPVAAAYDMPNACWIVSNFERGDTRVCRQLWAIRVFLGLTQLDLALGADVIPTLIDISEAFYLPGFRLRRDIVNKIRGVAIRLGVDPTLIDELDRLMKEEAK